MRIFNGLGGRSRALFGAVLALCLVPAGDVLALDEAQARGKRIYLEGSSERGQAINAVVGDEQLTLPASAVPCASCHGADGLGRPEGGINPPDVRWSQLTKSYGHVHENGRRHPAFDPDSLARVLSTGIDPAGNRLDRSMPLYDMAEEDLDDLVAYLQYLERDQDPGINRERVQVATLLPLRGPQARTGQAMAQVLHAHFKDVNAAGGVFGRRIELLTVPYGNSLDSTLETLRAAFRAEGIFAVVGAYTVGLDQPLLELLREEGAPLVAPFTLDPGDAFADSAAFYLYAGFSEQARVLVEHARGESGDGAGPMVVIGPRGGRTDGLVDAVVDQLRRTTAAEPILERYPPGALDAGALAQRIQEQGGRSLFFFGNNGELQTLLRALDAKRQAPRLYLLSSFASRGLFEAPAAFQSRIFVAYPTLASDFNAEGRAAYQDLSQRHALPPDHLQAQIAAFAAAKLLVEGMRRAGRDLNREKLVESLEALYGFKTGLTPPLTYGPNRRIGALGAHVVTVDLLKKTQEPVGGWHELR